MIRKKQFTGLPFQGILHQKEQRVDQRATRGITWNRPERWIVNTPFGQTEIVDGDWLFVFPTGNCYVIKDCDTIFLDSKPKKKWWKIW